MAAAWGPLPYAEWQDTCTTLHLWTQIVGKVRLAQTPWINHSWHATLYVTMRGLTTSPIAYGNRAFEIDFDFTDHRLVIRNTEGAERSVPLRPQTVADFYGEVMAALGDIGMPVKIHPVPNELPDPIAFDRDTVHASYDADYAQQFWRVLANVDSVFRRFRTGFLGKVSPVHFFWGSFDLAVTRFSGRGAPEHPGGIPHLPDRVVREAYSHEVSSAGFWPGGNGMDAAFYSYAYPAPAGFLAAPVAPPQAFFSERLQEFVLPYEDVRTAADPEAVLMEFLTSTYEAAANMGRWDRGALECSIGEPRVPRRI